MFERCVSTVRTEMPISAAISLLVLFCRMRLRMARSWIVRSDRDLRRALGMSLDSLDDVGDDWRAGAEFTRRHGLDARQDLVARVMLEQISLHAECDRGIEHRLLGTDSEKDDVDRQSGVPHPAGQRHPVHHRHADIDDGDIRPEPCRIFPGLRAIPGLGDHLERVDSFREPRRTR